MDSDSQASVALSQIPDLAKETAEEMASSATQCLNAHYESALQERTLLWAESKCDPVAIATLGRTSAALVHTGRRQAVLELSIYLAIISTFAGAALWMVQAPRWAWFGSAPVVATSALVLTLSGTKEHTAE